jgi:hypothetical protein
VHRGTAIVVPYGTPMPPGSTTPNQDGSHVPTRSMYVCQDGRWVGVVSYHESSIQLLSEAASVTAIEGAAVVMTGSCTYAGETAVTLRRQRAAWRSTGMAAGPGSSLRTTDPLTTRSW